jgi:carboxylesterase type B
LNAPSLGIKGNYGKSDVVAALRFVQEEIQHFGGIMRFITSFPLTSFFSLLMEVLPKPGDKSKLLLAGQSSGAEMIRSLLSTPDASGLFSKVALHSAPMNFKDYSASTSAQIGRVATKLLQNNTLASLQSLSVEAMLGVQANLTDGDYLTETVPGLSSIGEFFRPHVEEKRQDFGYYPQNHKPLPIALPMLFTSVKNEGCAKVNDL